MADIRAHLAGIDPLLPTQFGGTEAAQGPHGLRVVVESDVDDGPSVEDLAQACIQVGIMPSTVRSARWHSGEATRDQMRHTGGMFELEVDGCVVVLEHTGWDPYGEADYPWLLHRV